MNPPTPAVANPRPSTKVRRHWWTLSLALLGVLACGVWIVVFNGRPIWGKSAVAADTERPHGSSGVVTVVEVVQPKPGGIDRICIQPGTVEPFESADLYAKVSGFLKDTVDIGKQVHKGDILARLSVPEYEKQVDKDTAAVKHARAKLKQMEAHLVAAKAEAKAAEQLIAQVKIELKSKSAYRSYREKQLARIKKLDADKAIEAKLVDEETDRYEAAFEAENAAREAVTTAQLKSESAQAKVSRAEADIEDARAEIEVAQAELERAKVFLGYSIIPSPYDGVVTKRNFHPDEFIRSADASGDRRPVVAVDRTDLMRIVVQVPDRDVPFVDVGDPVEIEITALSGKPVTGYVARKAYAEDPDTRTMRTEIDVPNPDGRLCRNMYGRVKLNLQKGSPTALRIPSAALIGHEGVEENFVRIVRDHRVHQVPVVIGIDTGVEVEILQGLEPNDRVILRSNGPVEEGTEVQEVIARAAKAGH